MKRSRVIDFVLYFAISGLLVAMFIVAAVLGVDRRTFSIGTAYILFTLVLFLDLVLDSRIYLRRRDFWLFASVIFIVHTLGFWMIVRKDGVPRALWLGLVVEIVCVRQLRNLFFGKRPDPSNPGSLDPPCT